MGGNVLEVLAPAKVNLTLEVLGQRPDGFHEIRSIVQTVSLYDTLRFKHHPNFVFTSNSLKWDPEKSLVKKAVELLHQFTGYVQGVEINMVKHIPLMAGLGGDSSDAAATLYGLSRLWEINLTTDKLLELAAKLGSDVPLFIRGGTMEIRGRGDEVIHLPAPEKMWMVLVVPDVDQQTGKTERLYGDLKAVHYTNGERTKKLSCELKGRKEILPTLLFNTFESIAYHYFPNLSIYRKQMMQQGANNVHLTGSGPTLFTIFHSEDPAIKLFNRLKPLKHTFLVRTHSESSRN
jgi:4-diphosphocytidyl-2-C-methyl-D-erythritol kinase